MIHFRASNIGGCMRRIQLSEWGIEGLPPWEGQERAFWDGNMHERDILLWAASHLGGEGWRIRSQQKEISIAKGEGWELTGHIDGVMWAPGEKRVLLEAKCLSRKAFFSLREEGCQQAHPQYYAQVQAYLHGLQMLPYLRTEEAYLVARNKETPRTRMYDHHAEKITYDPDYMESIIDQLDKLAEAIENKVEIEPPYDPSNDWQCRPPWCPYTYVCWPGYRRPSEAEDLDAGVLLPLLERRAEIKNEVDQLKHELDELNDAIKDLVPEGKHTVGRWSVSLSVRRQERIDAKKARQILPSETLAQLVTVSESRVLSIEEKGEEDG